MNACDYLLPDGMTLAAAGEALTELLEVRDQRSSVGERSYYDTFDGRLHDTGLLAAWEHARLRPGAPARGPDARGRARPGAGASAARRRGGRRLRSTARRDSVEDLGPARSRATSRVRGDGRAEGAAGRDRGEHGRRAGGSR